MNKAIAEKAVGRQQENELTNQQWNMEVLEADQNEKGKRLEQEVNAEQLQGNKLDLIRSFQHDEKENELGLKEDELEPTEWAEWDRTLLRIGKIIMWTLTKK